MMSGVFTRLVGQQAVEAELLATAKAARRDSAQTVDAGTVGNAVADAGSPSVAVICGTDARYRDEVADIVQAARAAGVSRVYLAGPEKALGDAAHRPDEFLTAKINVVQALSNLLTRLGA